MERGERLWGWGIVAMVIVLMISRVRNRGTKEKLLCGDPTRDLGTCSSLEGYARAKSACRGAGKCQQFAEDSETAEAGDSRHKRDRTALPSPKARDQV